MPEAENSLHELFLSFLQNISGSNFSNTCGMVSNCTGGLATTIHFKGQSPAERSEAQNNAFQVLSGVLDAVTGGGNFAGTLAFSVELKFLGPFVLSSTAPMMYRLLRQLSSSLFTFELAMAGFEDKDSTLSPSTINSAALLVTTDKMSSIETTVAVNRLLSFKLNSSDAASIFEGSDGVVDISVSTVDVASSLCGSVASWDCLDIGAANTSESGEDSSAPSSGTSGTCDGTTVVLNGGLVATISLNTVFGFESLLGRNDSSASSGADLSNGSFACNAINFTHLDTFEAQFQDFQYADAASCGVPRLSFVAEDSSATSNGTALPSNSPTPTNSTQCYVQTDVDIAGDLSANASLLADEINSFALDSVLSDVTGEPIDILTTPAGIQREVNIHISVPLTVSSIFGSDSGAISIEALDSAVQTVLDAQTTTPALAELETMSTLDLGSVTTPTLDASLEESTTTTISVAISAAVVVVVLIIVVIVYVEFCPFVVRPVSLPCNFVLGVSFRVFVLDYQGGFAAAPEAGCQWRRRRSQNTGTERKSFNPKVSPRLYQ